MSEDTIFHKIIRREVPADIVYENDRFIVIKDINPVSPTHLLLIPKETLPGLDHANDSHQALLGEMLVKAAELAREAGVSEDGYRLVINVGKNGCQAVFQLHMHLIGGREFKWPPG